MKNKRQELLRNFVEKDIQEKGINHVVF